MSAPGAALLLAIGLPLLDVRAAAGFRVGGGYSHIPQNEEDAESTPNDDLLARAGVSSLLLHDSDSGSIGTLRLEASYDAPFGGGREITDGDYLFGAAYDLQHPFTEALALESSLVAGYGGRSRITSDPTIAAGATDADVLTTALSSTLTYQAGERWNLSLILEEASRVITNSDQLPEINEPDTHTGLFAFQFEHRFSDDLYAGGLAGAGASIEQTDETLVGPRLVGYADMRYRLFDPGVIELRAGIEVVRDPEDPDRQITPVPAGRAAFATGIRQIGLGMTLVYDRAFRAASRRIGVGVRDAVELTIGYIPEASPLLMGVTVTGARTEGFTEEGGESIEITAYSLGVEAGAFLTLTRNIRLFLEYNMGFVYEQLGAGAPMSPAGEEEINPAMTHVAVAGIQFGFGTDHDALERLISQDRFSEFAVFDVEERQRNRRQQPDEPDRRDPVDETDPTDRPRARSEEAPGPETAPEGGELEPPDPADTRVRRGRHERELLERQMQQQGIRIERRRGLRPTDRRRRPVTEPAARPSQDAPATPTEPPPPIVPVLPSPPGSPSDGAAPPTPQPSEAGTAPPSASPP